MKPQLISVILLAIFSLSHHVKATTTCSDTIEQPVNLGDQADPLSIPLGPVGWESNYGYGVHTIITASRPCQHGAMLWKNGSELEQNLAFAFGISLEPNGLTLLSEGPNTILVKSWDKPAYSPYTKEQVLAATLHCILRYGGGTKKHPLKINIKTQDPSDKHLEAKYSGNYITRADKDEKNFKPTVIPNTKLITDHMGVTHVQFTNIQKKSTHTPPQPILIPFYPESESENPDHYVLLPVWVGSSWKTPLNALGRPYYLFYNLCSWTSSHQNIHPLSINDPYLQIRASRTPTQTSVSITFHDARPKDLAATIYALIISAQPTESKPLTISLHPRINALVHLQPYLDSPGWEKHSRLGSVLQCTFILDPETKLLKKGSVPFVKPSVTHNGTLCIKTTLPTTKKTILDDKIDASYKAAFIIRFINRKYEPTEEELLLNHLKADQRKGMRWEMWQAGYRDAVLAYSNPKLLINPPKETQKRPSNRLSSYRNLGWKAGNLRGFDEGRKLIKSIRANLEK